jgi:hypothetical protein
MIEPKLSVSIHEHASESVELHRKTLSDFNKFGYARHIPQGN